VRWAGNGDEGANRANGGGGNRPLNSEGHGGASTAKIEERC
jgi:hypothetical protein